MEKKKRLENSGKYWMLLWRPLKRLQKRPSSNSKDDLKTKLPKAIVIKKILKKMWKHFMQVTKNLRKLTGTRQKLINSSKHATM